MSGVHTKTVTIIGSLTVVVVLMIAGVPTAPATGDPCSLTNEPAAIANRVCYERTTITEADGLVSNVAAGTHEHVTFVTFDVGDASFAVVSRDGETWTGHLPADDTLGLKLPHRVPTVLDNEVVASPYRLVHLATPMLPEWQEAFAAAGVTTHVYMPVNNFVVRLSDPNDAGLFDFSFVEEVNALPTFAKVEPALFEDQNAVRKVNILTMPDAPGAFQAVKQRLHELDTLITQEAPEIERLQAWVPASQLFDLAASPHVLWIDQAGEGEPEHDMDIIRQMVGTDYISGLPNQYDGSSVVGQVMDSELDISHPDFQDNLLIDYSAPQFPATIHGSSVFGIVFGDGTGNPQARGMLTEGKGTFAQFMEDTRYRNAAKMVHDYAGVFQTHSWGNNVPKDNTYDSYSNENDRVVMDLDVLMLQSMSNCGPQCARREAMAKNIVSVGGMVHKNTAPLVDDQWSSGRASTGPAADGRIKPELVGPYDSILTTTAGGYTSAFGGTSGATPVVAGALGLTYDMWNKGVFGTPAAPLKPATAKALLIASANAYDPNQVTAPGDTNPAHQWFMEPVKRDIQGWGLPDLMAMHDAAADTLVRNQEDALSTGQTLSFSYTSPVAATRVHVSLVWTDVPANPGASPTLVNDLDLVVLNGMGPYFGNYGLDQAELSLPLGVPDKLNNHEQVFLPALPGQSLDITVSGTAVNMDADPSTPAVDQPFALVVMAL